MKQSEKNALTGVMVGTAVVVGLGVLLEWLGPWWFWLLAWASACGSLIGKANQDSAAKKAADRED